MYSLENEMRGYKSELKTTHREYTGLVSQLYSYLSPCIDPNDEGDGDASNRQ